MQTYAVHMSTEIAWNVRSHRWGEIGHSVPVGDEVKEDIGANGWGGKGSHYLGVYHFPFLGYTETGSLQYITQMKL